MRSRTRHLRVPGNRVIRQMPLMIRHHPMQFVAAMKHVGTMIATRVEVTMPHAIRSDDPEIRVAARNEDVALGDIGDIDIGRHRLIRLFDHDGRRGCRHQRRRDRCIDPRIDNELALPVGRASCQDAGACNRSQ